MIPELRKMVTFDEVIFRDGDRAANPPLRLIGVAAVVKNPWHGRGFVEDLSPEINRIAPVLGKMLTDQLIALAGSGCRFWPSACHRTPCRSTNLSPPSSHLCERRAG